MAVKNADGELISFECTDLIKELEGDIREFGGDKLMVAIVVHQCGVDIYRDYDFYPMEIELEEGEREITMTASALLELFKRQNTYF